MDPTAFDTLARSFSQAGTRRRVLARLTALLPVAGLGMLLEEAADATRRHKRRRRRNRRRSGKHKDNRKGKRKGKGKEKEQGQPDPCLQPGTNLQAAINMAPAGGTITLCAGTFAAVNLQVNKPVTIVGQGAGVTILDAQLTATAITFNTNAALMNLTVTRSPAGSPAIVVNSSVSFTAISVANNFDAGILNNGDLSLSNVMVTVNQNSGIINTNSLNVANGSQITNNSTAQNGGGLFNASTGMANVTAGCTITGNLANGMGGGIFNQTGGTVTLQAANIVTNNNPTNCAPPNTINNCLN
jgi:hypothetical protein